MRNMGYIAIIFVIICLAPNKISAREVRDPRNLVTRACEGTLYKDLCKNTLNSFPESENADMHELAKMTLKYASLNGSYVNKQVKDWLWKSTSDEYAQQCFHDCTENYGDAVEQLEDSLVALHSKNYADVQTWLSAAMSDVESCGEGCNVDYPLAELNNGFIQLCSNALAIVNQLIA